MRQSSTASFPYRAWRKAVVPGGTVSLPHIGPPAASLAPGYFVVAP